MVRNGVAVHIILDTVGAPKGRQYSTGFEEVTYDVMEGSKWRVSLSDSGINEISEFGIFSFFAEVGEAEGEIDVWVGIKVF